MNAQCAAMSERVIKFKEKHRLSQEKVAVKSAELKAAKERIRELERSAGGKLNRVLSRFKPRRKEKAGVDFPKETHPPQLSVIVSAGGDFAQTARCLEAVREHTINMEVLVVGNELALKKLHSSANLQGIPQGQDLTFGKPHNEAAHRARSGVLVFLNDAMVVKGNWCEELLEPLHSFPKAGVVGVEAGLLKGDGSIELLDNGKPAAADTADFCTTACMAVTRNLFFQVAGFDGSYLPVAEVEFGVKIRRTRHEILHRPLCSVAREGPRAPIDAKRMEAARPKLRQWAEART